MLRAELPRKPVFVHHNVSYTPEEEVFGVSEKCNLEVVISKKLFSHDGRRRRGGFRRTMSWGGRKRSEIK